MESPPSVDIRTIADALFSHFRVHHSKNSIKFYPLLPKSKPLLYSIDVDLIFIIY